MLPRYKRRTRDVNAIIKSLVLAAVLIGSQPASAALVTLDFDGLIGPNTKPANLGGGEFDGTLTFDNGRPFPQLAATLDVTNGPLQGTYIFGAPYRVTYSATSFLFQAVADASLTFNLAGSGNGAYRGTFAFAQGSDTTAVGIVSIGSATAVPEPATWITAILGFGMIGAILRRKPRFVPLAG